MRITWDRDKQQCWIFSACAFPVSCPFPGISLYRAGRAVLGLPAPFCAASLAWNIDRRDIALLLTFIQVSKLSWQLVAMTHVAMKEMQCEQGGAKEMEQDTLVLWLQPEHPALLPSHPLDGPVHRAACWGLKE